MLSSSQRSRTLFYIFLLGIASECSAGTTSPIDLGQLFLVVITYLGGLVGLLIFLAVRRSRVSVLMLMAYICIPVIAGGGSIAYNQYNTSRVFREEAEGMAKNREAFSEYCKGRQRKIYSKAVLNTNGMDSNLDQTALSIRIDKAFKGYLYAFNAEQIASFMQKKTTECSRSTVRHIEGRYDGKYVQDKGYETEYRRYSACNKSEKIVVEKIAARYELVLGTTGSTERVPWERNIKIAPGAREWMSSSSVQIVDRFNGNVLAEDTMYFLTNNTGVGTCPPGDTQLAELIYEVFSRTDGQ